jgi:hypothetical protein
VQLKFADGSSRVEQRGAQETFQCIYDVLVQVLVLLHCNAIAVFEDRREPGGFYLVQMYPRREFTQADYSKTFAELGLLPSATILVLPVCEESVADHRAVQISSSKSAVSRTSFMMMLYALIMNPLQTMFRVIRSFFGFGTPSPPPAAAPAAGTTRRRSKRTPRTDFGQQVGLFHCPNQSHSGGECASFCRR